MVILIGAFIKFFIFGEAPVHDSHNRQLSTLSPTHKRSVSFTHRPLSPSKPQDLRSKPSASHILRPPPALTPAAILSKTYYNVQSHQPESLDWFNVLIAQTIAQLRADAHADDAILTSLTNILNSDRKPDFLSPIAVTEISLGEDFPIFSNCRVHPIDDDDGTGRLQARMDVDLSDFITLGIETTLVLNYPRPRTAILPVALSVSVVRFSGTLSISFLPASSPQAQSTSNEGHSQSQPGRTPTTLAFSFLPNYTLSLSTRSLLGSRSRLQDIPKIAQLVENQLRTWFEDRCVAPRMQQVAVPNMWPRMKNVVDGDGKTAKEGAGAGIVSSGSPSRDRDLREEAMREVEEEKARAEVGREWEGLRRRGMEAERERERERGRDLQMPGAMPGMLVS